MGKELKWLSLVLAAFSLTATAGPVWKKGAAIPVVTEGAACNPASDKVGVTSGNLILSCQYDGNSSMWKWLAQQGVGYGQTWGNWTGSSHNCAAPRWFGVVCTNSTTRPILVSVVMEAPGGFNAGFGLVVNGTFIANAAATTTGPVTVTGLVPPGQSYYVTSSSGTGTPSITNWTELR